MLQKISLLLLFGLVAFPTQSVHANEMCKRIFEDDSEVSTFEQFTAQSHVIRDNQTGLKIKIDRSSEDRVILNKEASLIFNQLTKNVPALLAKSKAIFQEYISELPYEKMASGISEVQMSLLDARGQTSNAQTAARVGAGNLREKINAEISEIKRKITQTENLAYELDMIADMVGNLSQNRKFQNNVNIYNSLVKKSHANLQILKGELKIVEALKQDLVSVIETQILKPSAISNQFYETTAGETKNDKPIHTVHYRPAPEKPLRQFNPYENHASRRPIPLPQQEQRRSTVQPGEQVHRVTVPAPDYTQKTGSVVGIGTLRSTKTTNAENPNQGVRTGTYATQSAITGKVDLNTNSKNMILALSYEAPTSRLFPFKETLEELRAWSQKYNIQNQILFSHSGRIEDPIAVTVKIKDPILEQMYLQKLKEDFASRSPVLQDSTAKPIRVEPSQLQKAEAPKPQPAPKVPAVIRRTGGGIFDMLNYVPALDPARKELNR